MGNLLWVAVALPLLGCIGIVLFGGRLPFRAVAAVACAAVFASFAVVLIAFVGLLALASPARVLRSDGWTWLAAGDFTVRAGLLIDPLAATLALIVTGVGGLIHVYAAGYMAEERDYARFFAEMNGFIAAMLLLTFADSVPLLAVGWIGVGIASALLIAFWYDRPGTVAAGRKAFLVNMVGDVGLIVAMAVFVRAEGTLDMAAINANVAQLPPGLAVVAAVGLLLAAGAKSAQLPLSGWLPDAMAGPTPVSALIHAATMVAAGIYLLIRLFPVIERSELLGLVAVVGALTGLYGGLCALVQPNLKRVLAYSTISQLGLMVFAIGLDAPVVAAFHLVTHAAFKAVLFLAAGSVIHALGGEEMLDGMGGLLRRLPETAIAFALGALALAGTPGLSGFFSKDAIADVAQHHGWLAYLAALTITALTAAYATRAFVRTFLGPTAPGAAHLHRPGPAMTVPQWLLAMAAVLAGYVPVQQFLAPRLGGELGSVDLTGAIVSTAVALVAAVLTWWLVASPARRRGLQNSAAGLHRLLLGGLGLDALVNTVVVRPVVEIAAFAQGAVPAASDTAAVPDAEMQAAEGVLAPLRRPNLHRHVAGLVGGALAIALYLMLRGA